METLQPFAMPELVNLFDKMIKIHGPFDIRTWDGGYTTESCWCLGKVLGWKAWLQRLWRNRDIRSDFLNIIKTVTMYDDDVGPDNSGSDVIAIVTVNIV